VAEAQSDGSVAVPKLRLDQRLAFKVLEVT
jgi:hypothetical protein